MTVQEFQLSFGPMAPTIQEQLTSQKLRAHYKDCKCWEEYKEAINRLFFAGLVTESERGRAEIRLFKKISKGVTSA